MNRDLRFPYLRIRRLAPLPEGAFIVVANHATYLDALFVWLAIRRPMRFLVWLEHYETPILGHFYRLGRAIPVDIWNDVPPITRNAYREALTHLQRGGVLGIFPEGGRTPDGRFLRWRPGAARLALTAGVPVVPVTLNGAYEMWPMHRRLPRPHPIEVIVHPAQDGAAYAHLSRREAAMAFTAALRRTVYSAYRLPAPTFLPPPDWPNPYLLNLRWREALTETEEA